MDTLRTSVIRRRSRSRRSLENVTAPVAVLPPPSDVTSDTDTDVTGIYFRLAVVFGAQLVLCAGLVLIVVASSRYLARYERLAVFGVNRYYRSTDFRRLDEVTGCRPGSTSAESVCTGQGVPSQQGSTGILPLKSHEEHQLADLDRWTLADFERRAQRRRLASGFTLVFIQALVCVTCFGFDRLVAAILEAVIANSSPTNDDVTSGPPSPSTDDRPTSPGCLPRPDMTSLGWPVATAVTAAALCVLLVGGLVLRARFLRLRDRIASYFYRKMADQRTLELYRLIRTRRDLRPLPGVLRSIARRNYQQQLQCSTGSFNISPQYSNNAPFLVLPANSPPRRMSSRVTAASFCCKTSRQTTNCELKEAAAIFNGRCLVCQRQKDVVLIPCTGRQNITVPAGANLERLQPGGCAGSGAGLQALGSACPAVLCADCWADIGRVCPLCDDVIVTSFEQYLPRSTVNEHVYL